MRWITPSILRFFNGDATTDWHFRVLDAYETEVLRRRCAGSIMLSLELAERGAKSASASSRWVTVDESAQLAHGPAWIVEVVLVEVHQRKSHAELVSTGERVCPQPIELDSRSPWVLKRTGEQR